DLRRLRADRGRPRGAHHVLAPPTRCRWGRSRKGVTMKLPYQEPLVPIEPGERQTPEPPRRGEPGGPPCGICTGKATGAVWSDEHWTLHPPVGGSPPGAGLIARREHFDSFADMPEEVAATFAGVIARAERAILSLGDV